MSKSIRTAVRIVVINEKGEVLLIHAAKKDYYQLPGGGVNLETESIEAVAKREALEETGYNVKLIKALGSYDEVGANRINRTYGFVASLLSKLDKNLEEDEVDFANKWVSLEEALNIMSKLLLEHKGGEFESFFQRERNFLTRSVDIFR